MFALVLSCDHGLPAPAHLSVHRELLAAVLDRLLNCLANVRARITRELLSWE